LFQQPDLLADGRLAPIQLGRRACKVPDGRGHEKGFDLPKFHAPDLLLKINQYF
jgi:hypothetical protein